MSDEPNLVPNSNIGIGTRIKGVIAKLGGVPTVEKTTDYKSSTLHRYIKEDSPIGLETAAELCRRAGISLDWLATGLGDPHAPKFESTGAGNTLDSEYALIPGYDIHASAGNGILTPDSEIPTRRLAFRNRWLQHRGLQEKDLVLVFAKGDSMEPTISDNNTLMVDTSEKRAEDGGIYVIRHADHLVVKRTQLVFGQGIRLISDNKAYPEQMVDFNAATDLEVVGRVVWIGKDV